MTKIPLYIITGFLGSGKTTFLQRVIKNIGKSKKLAVIQNEFAPANVDGRELKRTTNEDFSLLEINNGSVFCVCLLSGFISSLTKFVEQYNPEIIVMEASGLSDPVGIGEVFQSPQLSDKLYLAGSICIVDGLNILKTNKLVQRIQHQIAIADIIIINKTDLVEDVSEVEGMVKKINPLGVKFKTSYCDVDISKVLYPFENSYKLIIDKPPNNRPDINSCVLKSTKPLKS